MNYLVVELQTNDGTTSAITYGYNTLNEAKARYHLILSTGATSEIDIHSASILDERGFLVVNEYFEHEQIPEVSE